MCAQPAQPVFAHPAPRRPLPCGEGRARHSGRNIADNLGTRMTGYPCGAVAGSPQSGRGARHPLGLQVPVLAARTGQDGTLAGLSGSSQLGHCLVVAWWCGGVVVLVMLHMHGIKVAGSGRGGQGSIRQTPWRYIGCTYILHIHNTPPKVLGGALAARLATPVLVLT